MSISRNVVSTLSNALKFHKMSTKKEHKKFKGQGLNFKGKLIGIAEVAHAHGDAMCQQTLTSLKESAANAREQAGDHKKRIVINLTLEHGLRVLDERTKSAEFQHRMETVAFVCRDADDERVFCYIASVGAGKHFLYAVKTAQPAAGAVTGISELIAAIMDKNVEAAPADPLSDDLQPSNSPMASLTQEISDVDVNDVTVKPVRGRVPSTSSSEGSESDETPNEAVVERKESSVAPEMKSSDSSLPAPPEITVEPAAAKSKLEESGESKQVETFGVEIYIPKKTGSPPKPLRRKKGQGPSLDEDIAKFNYGLEFKAKLVGVEEMGAATGDKMKMAEDAMERLKASLTSSKEHKQRITVDISLEGIRIMDEKTRRLLFLHPVHNLVFIAFDVKGDLRGCGYIAAVKGQCDFIGIKSMEKSCENLVSALQELIALSFEVKVQELMKTKQKTEEEKLLEQSMKDRSASYRSIQGLPAGPPTTALEDFLLEETGRDKEQVKAELENLQELMDKGDALRSGYNNYEEKIQEHKAGKLSTTVMARFGNKDKLDTILGKVERVWFPGVAEDKLRVKWLLPKEGVSDEFVVTIKPKPEGDAPHEYTVQPDEPPDVTFFGLTPNTIYTVYVSAAHQGKLSNPGIGSERTLPIRESLVD